MQPQEEDEHDDEEMGVAETYADYWPSKCKLRIGNLIFRAFDKINVDNCLQ